MMLKNTSNQRGANSVTICPLAAMLVASKAAFLENYLEVSTWILDGSLIEWYAHDSVYSFLQRVV